MVFMISKEIETFNDFNHIQVLKVPMITVYFNPRDYQGKYVARLFNLEKPTPFVMVKDSLEEIRKGIPERFMKINRSESDDKSIVEVWL